MRIWPVMNKLKERPYGIDYTILQIFILNNDSWYASALACHRNQRIILTKMPTSQKSG